MGAGGWRERGAAGYDAVADNSSVIVFGAARYPDKKYDLIYDHCTDLQY